MEKNKQTSRDSRTYNNPEGIKTLVHHLPYNERYDRGKQLRENCPRSTQAKYEVPSNRMYPLELLLESEKGRITKLLPLRHDRIARSPFTFYRGSAFNMAAGFYLGSGYP
jgi:hypothetical protein